MLPRTFRITDRYTYNKVKRFGEAFHTPSMIVSVMKGGAKEENTKFGLIVTNKVDGRAVVRHRAKRLITTYLQENLTKFGKGNLIVIVGKSQVAGKKYEEIVSEFDQVLPKIHFS